MLKRRLISDEKNPPKTINKNASHKGYKTVFRNKVIEETKLHGATGYRHLDYKREDNIPIHKYTRAELETFLTSKQKAFCREYMITFNGTKSYMKSFSCENKNGSSANASKLLHNHMIIQYLEFVKRDYETVCGLSKQGQLAELKKIAYSSLANLHNNWIELKDWEQIKRESPEALDAIETIDIKTETLMIPNPMTEKKEPVEVKYIRLKLYDKIKALESINNLMGYNKPEVIEVKQTYDISVYNDDELSLLLKAARRSNG